MGTARTNKPLWAELGDRDIPIIPQATVEQHKRAVLQNRSRAEKIVSSVFKILDGTFGIAALVFIPNFVERGTGKLHGLLYFVGIVLLGVVGLYVAHRSNVPSIVFWIPALAFALAMAVRLLMNLVRLGGLATTWDRAAFDSFFERRLQTPPGKIFERAARVRDIPGAVIRMDIFTDLDFRAKSPFLVVTRGWFKQEVCYIGAWDTGEPQFDDI